MLGLAGSFLLQFTYVNVSQQSVARALQQAADDLEWLTIDIWPDYDRRSVLVLFTGSLRPDASLPAAVSLPLPQDATLNAVARITDDNQMIDDIEFENDDGTLTLVTPDRRFRIEYYLPYETEGLRREFTFDWGGGPAVAQLDVSVQQPRAATSIAVVPAPESVVEGTDGLQYHNLPVRELQAAGSFTVEVNYSLSSEQLTAAAPADNDSEVVTPPEDVEAEARIFEGSLPLILAVLGVTLLLLAIGWQVFGARLMARRAPRKPRPLRAMRGQSVQFCHQCGTRAQSGDRFCRECGTELKKG